MGKRILKFPEEGLKQLQFFMEGLSFPVAVAAYSEQDIGKLSYLIRLLQRGVYPAGNFLSDPIPYIGKRCYS